MPGVIISACCAWVKNPPCRTVVESYQRAIRIIQQDPKVCSKPVWQESIRHIEHLKRCARDHQPPDQTVLGSIWGRSV